MASKKYTYSVSTDTINGKVASDALQAEIVASTISIPILYININSDALDIWMNGILTTSEETLLTSVVNAHIGATLPRVVDTIKIQEEAIGKETGGHYQAQTFEITTTANTGWFETEVSFPFPISLLSAEWVNQAENEHDETEFQVAPDTIIGNITADSNIGDTVINVSKTVVDNTFIGAYIKLFDGTVTNDVGRVVSVDTTNFSITVETPTVNAFAASTPTYVQQTVKIVPHLVLHGSNVPVSIGESKIGGSNIPANTVLKARYYNKSATVKTFSFLLEYLY